MIKLAPARRAADTKESPDTRMVGVVVGVDETAGCEPALEYAFEQARLGQLMLHAVHAWQEPEQACAPYELEALGALKREFTAGRIDIWRPKYPEITVVADVRLGHPVDVLVEASVGADLLVVGAHGKTAHTATLGSVSGGVLYRASCPVVVVRCRKEGRDND
ncbi:hypothetical protein Aple_069930 [Acrocarpospora pleiomorpha]|uniref:UspA domain-containing protein n=1 Tax=Acrocarpospora pleiomorpha TaxID=90975 RepID=A0A5M3XS73_9ACTN|nr:universal stress protein [Acrocarpospora pleiomorpha]GES24094.1 hypothetical protein Aple_069930 [Acrocarpospora pleiomorpha]